MYKIIGSDGQEYGPVSAEEIRRWISENRAHAQTRVQAEGSQEWKPLNEIPEFADALASKSPPPASPGSPLPFAPPPPKPDADAMAAEILARDYQVEIGACVSRSWNLLTRHFWLIVGAWFVLSLIMGAVPLLDGVCMGSFYVLLLKLMRGERTQFGDAFLGFSLAFVQLFLAGLVKLILTYVGLMFCILPGIYLAVAWTFALPLVVDQKLDFWPAMELSRKVVTRHWWAVFGLVLVNVLLFLLGAAACGIGVLITVPVAFGAYAYAYEDIFGRNANVPRPA